MTDDLGTPDSILPTGEEGYNHGTGDATLMETGEDRRIRALDPGIRTADGQSFRLMRDLVAVKPDALRTNYGGIIIPDTSKGVVHNTGELVSESDRTHTGVVVAVGPGRRRVSNGRRLIPDVSVGERVCYDRATGSGLVWHDGNVVALIHSDGDASEGDSGIHWVELDVAAESDYVATP